MTKKPNDRKRANGRFAKGASGNPAGRPPSSRNQSTLLMEALLEDEAEPLLRKAIELASGGDIYALKLCLDRLLPPCKDRAIHLSLPPIENAQQVSAAMSTVVEAVGEGRITPGQGETVANILAVKKDVLAACDFERRLEQVEQAISILKNATVDAEAADRKQEPGSGRSPEVMVRDSS